MAEETKEKKVNMYDCAVLFAETINEKFPNGCPDGSALILAVTDGNKISSIINGDDDLIINLIADLSLRDSELCTLIGEGLTAALKYKIKEKLEKENGI